MLITLNIQKCSLFSISVLIDVKYIGKVRLKLISTYRVCGALAQAGRLPQAAGWQRPGSAAAGPAAAARSPAGTVHRGYASHYAAPST